MECGSRQSGPGALRLTNARSASDGYGRAPKKNGTPFDLPIELPLVRVTAKR